MTSKHKVLTDYLSGEYADEPFVFPGWVREMMRPAALAGSEPVRDALSYILELETQIAALTARIDGLDGEKRLRKAIEADMAEALRLQGALVRAMQRGGGLPGTIEQYERVAKVKQQC
jgi:uncharacterized small protein (DUF1192 family)